MKIVIMRPPAFLSPILRRFFGIKKKDKKIIQMAEELPLE
mgnify:CR=1 FL=1